MHAVDPSEVASVRVWMATLGAMLALVLAACAPVPARNPLASWVPSPHHDARRPVLIVLHFTDEASLARSLAILRSANASGPVSAHYLLGTDGHIYQLVADSERAWHAGAGRWGTITDVNSASIGIELVNDGHAPFPDEQIDSLLVLLADLTMRWRIPPTQVIGHEDLAPARKLDPGPRFPWARLAAAGYGLWPRVPLADPPPGFDPWLALAAIGYPLDDRAAAVRAFRHHFRSLEGEALEADDLRVLYALARQLEGDAGP